MSTEEHRRAASDVRQRTELVGLRLTPDEHSAAESRAAAAGVTVQELIRHLLAAPTSPSEPVPSTPRVWAMPEIPEDVTRFTAVGGDMLIERDEDEPDRWFCRSAITGRVLSLLPTYEVLGRYGPLVEEETNDAD